MRKAIDTPRRKPTAPERVTALWHVLEHRKIELDGRIDPIRIGRGRHCQVQVAHIHASMDHCEIIPDTHGGFMLRDLKSTNGTLVNQIRVDDEIPLSPGMYIMVAEAEFIVLGDDTRLPLAARSWSSFRRAAAHYYGTDERAGDAIGTSRTTILRARHAKNPPRESR